MAGIESWDEFQKILEITEDTTFAKIFIKDAVEKVSEFTDIAASMAKGLECIADGQTAIKLAFLACFATTLVGEDISEDKEEKLLQVVVKVVRGAIKEEYEYRRKKLSEGR